MPRKLAHDITFEDTEDEIFFTRAAVKADPDSKDLLPHTDDWLGTVDATRAKDRAYRMGNADATAARVIANDRLDRACVAFLDELFLAVKKDRKAPRWLQFLTVTVSSFVRQRFDKQVARARAWLSADPPDPVLDAHRTPLTTWTDASEKAIAQTNGLAMVRGAAQIAREQMADDLTRDRDELWELLAQRARERGLPREWPNLFFKTESRKRVEPAEESAPADGNG